MPQMMSALKSEVDRLVSCDIKAASSLAEHIERLATHLGDPLSKGFAEASRARVLHNSGRPAEANKLYETALAVMRGARLTEETALIRIHQVYALTQMSRYDDALKVARLARRSQALSNPIRLAQLETNVGNIYYMLDRYARALKHYDRAGALFSGEGQEGMLAYVDFARSNVFTDMDRPGEAEVLLESAASRWTEAGNNLLASQARFHIAYLQFLRGNYNSALAAYYDARDRVSDLGGDQLIAWCDLEIAEILLALNSFDDAAARADSSRTRFTELGMTSDAAKATLVRALANLGLNQLEQAQGDFDSAREVFDSSGNRTLSALCDSYLAELQMRRGLAEEAERHSRAALRVFTRQGLVVRSAYSRMLIARAAYERGDRARASRIAHSVLRAIEGRSAPTAMYKCHHLIGRIKRDRKRTRAALESFRRSVEIVEGMRGGIAANEFKASFLRDKIEVYEDAITACLDIGGDLLVEEAFQLVESSKSRALADLLARYLLNADQADSKTGKQSYNVEARERLRLLIEDLNWFDSQAGLEDDKGNQRSVDVADRYRRAIAHRERQIAQLFRRMEIEDSSFAYVHRMQPATCADLRESLMEGETAIEYFAAGDEVSAFVATRDQVKVIRAITSRSQLRERLAQLRFQIEKFSYGAKYVDAHFWQLKWAADCCLSDLYDSIFAPLEPELKTEQLIIIPHGALHYVPFHALCDRRGDYLIERFEVSYAPSAAVFKLCRRKKSGTAEWPLVALGVSEPATPGIKEELDRLQSIFEDAVMLKEGEATRANLMRLAPGARFLHLASHGYFRRDNPMFSFLKLADARLNFYNLLDLKLNAEMVTLSACHTGVNTIFPGDELHGLVRGFLYAGAPALVVSLWAVNDTSTAELMSVLYANIREGGAKRAALRAAQLAIKDEYGHPYYWAPFVLMGNPG